MVLRTVAMVLGIIGGVYGLIMGLIGGGITAAFLSSSSNASLIYSAIALLLGLAPPIIGVVGAAIVRNKPLLGSSLMGVSSIVMGTLGFIFPLAFVLAPPAAFFLVGAILGAIGKFQS
jgi:hypothetical protein